MVYSSYTKTRILSLYNKGSKSTSIAKVLEKEGLIVSVRGIQYFLKKYNERGNNYNCVTCIIMQNISKIQLCLAFYIPVLTKGNVARKSGSGRPSKITLEIKRIVDKRMEEDDETTAYQLYNLLKEKGYSISLRTVLRCRSSLGWTFRGSSYCQLIRHINKEKRLEWARQHLDESEDGFGDVIWTDETSVQMESHKRHACHRKGEKPKPKPR